MSNNFSLLMRVRGGFLDSELENVLDRVRDRHPLLVTRLRPGAPQPAPSGDRPRFPLRVLTGCSDTDWIRLTADELLEPFPENSGPSARFSLLRGADFTDILATFDHSVADGIGGMFVLRDILQILSNPSVQMEPLSVPPPMWTFIPSALFKNAGFQLRVNLTVLLLRLSVWFERFLPRRAAQNVSSLDDSPLSQEFVILPEALTVSQTTTLADCCKTEAVSVHAAICTAWLMAFAELQGGKKGWKYTVSSPVNLRGRLSRSMDETASLALSMVETSLDCRPGRDFWKMAREFKRKFAQDAMDANLFLKPALFTRIFSSLPRQELESLARKLFTGPVNHDFSITNLGRLTLLAQTGALKVEAFYGPLVNSSPYERTVGIATLDGKLTMTYLLRRSNMEPEQATALMDRVLALLGEATGW